MKTMTSRQRIDAAFSHLQPDRTPIFEYVLLSPVADAVLGRRYADFGGDYADWAAYAQEIGCYEAALRQYARDRIDLARKLGHDMIYCVPNPPESVMDFRPQPLEIVPPAEDPVESVRRRNEQRREALSRSDSSNSCLIYQYLREEMERQGLDLPLYAPAFSHGIWTDVELMETMLLDPEVAHEHFAIATESCRRSISRLAAAGADMIGIGGDFAGNRPLISPAAYREFIAPELKGLSDQIHSLNCRAVNASDGDLWSVIDDFLLTSGVDAYGEIDFGAGMDLKKLKERFGQRITFFGNMDCGNILSFSSPETIQEQTIRCIEDGMGSGGHVFTASNAISASVPLSNYLAMVNAYRDYFRLPHFSLS